MFYHLFFCYPTTPHVWKVTLDLSCCREILNSLRTIALILKLCDFLAISHAIQMFLPMDMTTLCSEMFLFIESKGGHFHFFVHSLYSQSEVISTPVSYRE